MGEITIKIDGMSCGGCVRKITGLLQALPGVEQAEVSLEAGEARVRFDPAAVTVAAMHEVVDAAGFEVGAES